MPLDPGTRLGPYEVVSPLGAGGMGEVYRARDTKLGRDVAVKVLPREFAADTHRLERFEQEARLLAALNHPNIASIHGFEESDDVAAIVLELVDGPTLAERIRQGPVGVEEALGLAAQIAQALEAAHEAGVIHRDLKPANVKLTSRDAVKVLDFGLAKQVGSEELETSELETRSKLTEAGTILGTAPYMSPEQIRGEPIDARSDVWAFGCVLFEMLSGLPAFLGRTRADTIACVLTGAPDWNRLPDAAPPPLVALIRRCLEKAPDDRPPSMAEVRRQLVDVAAPAREPAAGGGGLGSPSWAWVAVTLAIVAAAVLGYRLLAESPTRSTESAPVRLTGQLLATPGPGAYHSPTLSPDGTTTAFVSETSGVARIWVQTLTEGAEPIPITDEEAPALHPSWSPTSEQIAFHRPGFRHLDRGPARDAAAEADHRAGDESELLARGHPDRLRAVPERLDRQRRRKRAASGRGGEPPHAERGAERRPRISGAVPGRRVDRLLPHGLGSDGRLLDRPVGGRRASTTHLRHQPGQPPRMDTGRAARHLLLAPLGESDVVAHRRAGRGARAGHGGRG